VTSFERWEESEQRFDIVASAQAWHWVDAEVGVAKAARVLLKNGLLALWWNMPSSDRTTGSRLLDGIYETLAPELLDSSVMVRAKSDGRHTRRVEESPAFDRPYEVEYEWSEEYTADAYVALLATHSDHQAMPPDRRERLLNAVHSEVARMGTIEFRYVTECLIARRL
jgi:SAM-dependent methyltransferase